jgi:uncharacterized protein (DUF1778 family)
MVTRNSAQFPEQPTLEPPTQPSSEPLTSTTGRKPARLPYRTTPETYQAIAEAAKQADLSINAWMDRTLSQAAEAQLQADPAEKVQLSQSLADLVDEFKPLLKSDRTYATFEFLGAVQELVAALEAVQKCVKGEDLQLAAQVVGYVDDIMHKMQPLSRYQTPESTAQLTQTFERLLLGIDAVKQCLKPDSPQLTQQITESIIQHIASLQGLAVETPESVPETAPAPHRPAASPKPIVDVAGAATILGSRSRKQSIPNCDPASEALLYNPLNIVNPA